MTRRPQTPPAPTIDPSFVALLAETRALAVRALDAGQPVVAATLANAADRLEAQQLRLCPWATPLSAERRPALGLA